MGTAGPGPLNPVAMVPVYDPVRAEVLPWRRAVADLAWVRRELEAGRIAMLGEVGTQLFGIYPSSPELEPYFSLAEEFDIRSRFTWDPGHTGP